MKRNRFTHERAAGNMMAVYLAQQKRLGRCAEELRKIAAQIDLCPNANELYAASCALNNLAEEMTR